MWYLRITEAWKSGSSTMERATGPRWCSGVQDIVWGRGLSHQTTGWVGVKSRETWWSDRRVLPQ